MYWPALVCFYPECNPAKFTLKQGNRAAVSCHYLEVDLGHTGLKNFCVRGEASPLLSVCYFPIGILDLLNFLLSSLKELQK